jgi:two-component system nitrate/nitrite sensor histidine kinase NarX
MIRIVQESLSNIRKHSQADLVIISCRELENRLVLETVDNGIGFSPDDIARPSQHGLRGMKERAELIGADFQIISRPGEGTKIRLDLPLSVINNGNVHR